MNTFKIKIKCSDLPKKNLEYDFDTLERICQMQIKEILFNDCTGEIKRVNDNDKDTLMFEEIYSKYLRLTKYKEIEPIHSPFAANRCPRCNANLGGKKIDGIYYENPYYPKCPNCGVMLKRLDWQNADNGEKSTDKKESVDEKE